MIIKNIISLIYIYIYSTSQRKKPRKISNNNRIHNLSMTFLSTILVYWNVQCGNSHLNKTNLHETSNASNNLIIITSSSYIVKDESEIQIIYVHTYCNNMYQKECTYI